MGWSCGRHIANKRYTGRQPGFYQKDMREVSSAAWQREERTVGNGDEYTDVV